MTNRLGQQLGNYRLINLLGRGGFAEVYLGEHIHLGTQAAIKVLHTQVNTKEIEMFRKEARTIARLEHPRIVRVLEFGIENDSPYLVMTYAPNGTLRQRHPKGEQLPPKVILPYVEQVAEALQYIHDQKLIHRDVKPENLLLNSSENILLSDFGIASVAHTTISLTAQGQAGTPHYMAPEQILNKPGSASDQYALGVVVYEWLSGIHPYQGDVFNIFFQHLNTPPTALRERLSTIPPLVDVVVLKALSKDPKQRFASVKAFANALKHASMAEQATPSIVTATSIAPDSSTQKAEEDTKSDQILPPTQPIPTADQPSLSPGMSAPINQPQRVNDVAQLLSSTIPPSQIMPLPNQPPVPAASHQQTSMPVPVSQSGGVHLPKRNLPGFLIPIGIFLIFLAFAFYFSNTVNSSLFLPIFFAGLALVSLVGAANSGRVNSTYTGLYPFVWLLGLALCFLIGFWPWILVIPGMTLIIYFLGKLLHVSTPPIRLLPKQAPWFWIILAIIAISLLSGGRFFSNGLNSVHNPLSHGSAVGQPIDYKVNGQANLVINDPNGNVTVTEGQSNTDVIIQPLGAIGFAGNPNAIQHSISQTGNTITAQVQNSVDLQVTVPKGAHLSMNTDSGDINVSGVDGQMTFVTTNGTITASNDLLSNSSTFTTNSGDINFDGTIHAGGNYQFNTTDGTITVALPSSPAFHVVATTNSGSITIPGIQNNSLGTQATGNVGASSSIQGTIVTMKSDSGDITLNQR